MIINTETVNKDRKVCVGWRINSQKRRKRCTITEDKWKRKKEGEIETQPRQIGGKRKRTQRKQRAHDRYWRLPVLSHL